MLYIEIYKSKYFYKSFIMYIPVKSGITYRQLNTYKNNII